jgi:hypothetical protein
MEAGHVNEFVGGDDAHAALVGERADVDGVEGARAGIAPDLRCETLRLGPKPRLSVMASPW